MSFKGVDMKTNAELIEDDIKSLLMNLPKTATKKEMEKRLHKLFSYWKNKNILTYYGMDERDTNVYEIKIKDVNNNKQTIVFRTAY